MRQNRVMMWLIVAAVMSWLPGSLWAAERPNAAKQDNVDSGFGEKQANPFGSKLEGKAPVKDPVAAAFAIPRKVTLNAKQQDAYSKLKADKEPKLREAIERIEQSTEAGPKAKAAKEARQLRKEISTAMAQILNMPYAEARQKAQQEAAKQAEELRKRMEQWRKDHPKGR